MSEIDIERKESGGIPWWAWLLGLLALLALIWYVTAAMSAKPQVAAVGVDNGALVADADPNAMATDTNMADANMDPAMGADTNMADANMAPAMGADTNMDDMSMSNSADSNSTVPAISTAAITNILSVVDATEPTQLYGKQVRLKGAPVQAAGTDVFWVGPSFEQKILVVTDASTNMNGINTGVAQRDRVNIEGTVMEIKDFDEAKTKYKLDDDAITFLTNKKIMLMATSISRDKN